MTQAGAALWLAAGMGSSWEMGWSEVQGLSPEGLLCAAGMAQGPWRWHLTAGTDRLQL